MKDEFVKLSKKEGVRSRSAFKLDQMLTRFPELSHCIKTKNACVIDLGAAPGGWSQILSKYASPTTKIFAVDILPLKPLDGVKILNIDFSLGNSKNILMNELKKEEFNLNLIVSDLCVNLTGTQFLDISRNLSLWNEAFEFSIKMLNNNGNFVLKIFESPDANQFAMKAKNYFRDVFIFKPKASRTNSSEKYLICLNKK